jgi:predicted transcriptional regulator
VRATVKVLKVLPENVVGQEDDIGEILFTLANQDRLVILRSLREQRLRLTQLAKRISATPQETSRHVARLSRSGLIERNPSGAYGLTDLGELALHLLPAWEVVSARREYFLSHHLLELPEAFLERLGDLSRATYEDGLASVLAHMQAAFADAREYVWMMGDQVLGVGFDPLKAIEDRGLSIRIIIPERALSQIPTVAADPTVAWPDRLELAVLDEVKFGIAMNERSAGVVFADAQGKLDFNRGFQGVDPTFHAWCRDLFEQYWARAKRYRPL